jgi:hemolysin activation/secretion protein
MNRRRCSKGAVGLHGWLTVSATTLVTALAPAEAQETLLDRPSSRPIPAPEYLPTMPEEGFELPPVLRPPTPGPPAGQALPVKGFRFQGNRVVDDQALQAVAAPYAGRDLTASDLEELRQSLSRYYVDRGYINSGALLPTDFYRGGIVHFRIVEGRIDEVRFQGLGRLRETYVRQRLTREDEPLDVNALQERFQLLLTDPLFAKVNARLQPGADPGQATLEVDVTRARPWELSLYLNNHQPPTIGAEAAGVSGVLRNLTGLGDTVDATFQHGREDTGSYTAGWSVPLNDRVEVHARVVFEQSTVLEEPLDELDLDSEQETYEAGLALTLIDTIRRRLALGLTYAHRENSTSLLDEPFSFVPGEPTGTSKADAWRLEQHYLERWQQQTLALRSTFTWGHTNVDSDAGPSELLPAKQYFFWLGQAQFSRLLSRNGTTLSLRGTLQWTRDRLVPLERIAVGGVYSVRGYRENQAVRDQGYYGSFEVRFPLLDRPAQRHRLSLIPFFDFGEAWNTGGDREQLRSVGVGVNWQFRGLSAELYYGMSLVDPEIVTSSDLQDDGIHFQLRYQL